MVWQLERDLNVLFLPLFVVLESLLSSQLMDYMYVPFQAPIMYYTASLCILIHTSAMFSASLALGALWLPTRPVVYLFE